MILEYILIGVLLCAAAFIVVAVALQKSGKEGLSGTIVGGAETYYGKDDSVKKDKRLCKWTLIVSIIFAVAVAVVYIVQPDYPNYTTNGGLINVPEYESWVNSPHLGDYIGVPEVDYVNTATK